MPGLDSVLAGGYPTNQMFLVEGDPGTGKTTLALQFLLEGVRSGERGLYVTLSEKAANGRAGLELIPSAEIDLVLCDVILPEMSGHELGRRLSSIRPDIPILYMSGYPGLEVVERGLIPHDAPFIEKPFTADGLASSVRGLLNQDHATRGGRAAAQP